MATADDVSISRIGGRRNFSPLNPNPKGKGKSDGQKVSQICRGHLPVNLAKVLAQISRRLRCCPSVCHFLVPSFENPYSCPEQLQNALVYVGVAVRFPPDLGAESLPCSQQALEKHSDKGHMSVDQVIDDLNVESSLSRLLWDFLIAVRI